MQLVTTRTWLAVADVNSRYARADAESGDCSDPT
jgi:hypothetical protein